MDGVPKGEGGGSSSTDISPSHGGDSGPYISLLPLRVISQKSARGSSSFRLGGGPRVQRTRFSSLPEDIRGTTLQGFSRATECSNFLCVRIVQYLLETLSHNMIVSSLSCIVLVERGRLGPVPSALFPVHTVMLILQTEQLTHFVVLKILEVYTLEK